MAITGHIKVSLLVADSCWPGKVDTHQDKVGLQSLANIRRSISPVSSDSGQVILIGRIFFKVDTAKGGGDSD